MRAVLYLRLSDARNENGSFADREGKLRALADRLGWSVAEVVTENDLRPDGTPKPASAWKRRRVKVPGHDRPQLRVIRPGYRKVLAMLERGKVSALLAEDLDRMMRDPRDLEDLVDVVRERGAWADSLSGSLKFTAGGTDAEVMTARLMVAVASKSSADTARRVAAARERKATAGAYGGGRRPFGFLPDGVTVDPVEAGVIRSCAYAVLRGSTLRGLARDLNERGVPTVTGRARWTAQTLRDVLLRERNAGRQVYRGEVIGPAPWQPIVPGDVHDRVVALLRDTDRRTQVGRPPAWLGSGLYRCGVCGAHVEITIGGRAPRYRCRRSAHLARDQRLVDRLVVGTVLGVIRRDAPEMFVPQRPEVDVAALRDERAAIEQNLATMAADAVIPSTGVTRAQVHAANARAAARVAEIDALLATAVGPDPAIVELAHAADPWAVWEGLTLETQRLVVATAVQVTLLPTTRRGRGIDPDSVRIDPAGTR